MLASALLLPSVAHAGTASGQIDVAILRKLSLVKTADLDFGKIINPLAAGTVTLVPTASATCTVTGGLIRSGNCTAAEFYGWGDANRIVKVNTPNPPITITGPGGATMTITNLSLDATSLIYVSGNVASNGFVRYRIASANGVFSFRLGGRLNVAANQAFGRYTGTFTVTLDYQ